MLLVKGKGKVFYGQEPLSGESTTTEYGVNYQLYWINLNKYYSETDCSNMIKSIECNIWKRLYIVYIVETFCGTSEEETWLYN